MEMPIIKECDAPECAYNDQSKCHALAITVGDEMRPQCDTLCTMAMMAGDAEAIGRVGACKMSGCMHNSRLECTAPGITVGHRGDEVDCLAYAGM